jgi:hypothetical protein
VRLYFPVLAHRADNSKKASPDSKQFRALFHQLTGLPVFMASHVRLFPSFSHSIQLVNQDEFHVVDDAVYQYPVVIVSQDYNGVCVEALQSLCERMAKDGWIVVSVKHTNINCSALNPFFPSELSVPAPETTELEPDEDNRNAQEQRTREHANELVRILDIILSIQYGQFKLNTEESVECRLLKGRMDLERLVILGCKQLFK